MQVIVLFPNGLQLPLASGVACAYMALLLCRRPYVRARDDVLALIAQTNIVLLLLVGYLLKVRLLCLVWLPVPFAVFEWLGVPVWSHVA